MTTAPTPDFFDVLCGVLERPSVRTGVERLVVELAALRDRGGRLFVIGVGGGAANAAHAVNDFRKLCDIEAYAPADNVAELTARANDEGWPTIFRSWLDVSNLRAADAIFVMSVGGGTETVSPCITEAVSLAKSVGARVLGVVGRAGGATAMSGGTVIVADVGGDLCTPVAETVQIAVLHALVSDPRLKVHKTTW